MISLFFFPGDPPDRLASPLFTPSHKCHQQNISWWLFCPRYWLFFHWVSHNSLQKNVQKVGERRQPCLTPMVVRRKGRLHWWLCYWAACGTARLENELSREKRQNGGLTTQKALLLPTIGRPLVWLSSGEDGSFPKGKKFWKKFGRHPRKFFWLLLPHHPCEFHSGLPMSFFFSFLLSLYLSSVLLSHVFSSSVFFFRCTFCPFFYPMSFPLQFSSFVVPFARSAIPCLFQPQVKTSQMWNM